MAKTAVQLYRPDGGTILQYDDVVVSYYNKDTIAFQRRVEDGDKVTVTEYTSTLPYVICETFTGPKSLV